MHPSTPIFGSGRPGIGPVLDPSNPETVVEAAEGDWVSQRPTSAMRVIYKDDERGVAAYLIRMSEGDYSPPHSHSDSVEQLYIIEGRLNIGERVLAKGDYLVRLPRVDHAATTDCETLVFTIFTKSG
jgi:quercetin dioxygenase-like cupin family protein